jgi:predicted deacylase
MANSLITSEIDFDAEGRQTGYLRVPNSTHRSAYGWIGVPAICLRNGDGPTVLMLAGNHGDEYEGQIALSRLAQSLRPEDIQGRLILLPALNAPAAEAGTRTSPVDDGNLNRSFPGDPNGSPTQMIAHYVETVLLPLCDVLIDLHSGGSSLYYPPTLLRGQGGTAQDVSKLRLLQHAFDLPYAWVFTGVAGRQSTGRTAMAGANRQGVVSIMAELGGAGSVDPTVLAATERGLRRILHSLEMLPGYIPDAQRGTRELHSQGSVYAYDVGIFEPVLNIGAPVAKQDLVGLIHTPLVPWAPPIEIRSPYDGIVLCKRAMGQVQRGDAVAQIARDAD